MLRMIIGDRGLRVLAWIREPRIWHRLIALSMLWMRHGVGIADMMSSDRRLKTRVERRVYS